MVEETYSKPSISATDTDMELMVVAGLKDDERIFKLRVRSDVK